MSFVLMLGIGVASGLNPYVVVAITAIVASRSDLWTPVPEFEFIGLNLVLGTALLLLLIDVFADKFHWSGQWMDRAGWLLRPAAGGLLGGVIVVGDVSNGMVVGVALGGFAALLTHALRLRIRRRVQPRLLGFGRVVVGAYGNFGSGIVTMIAFMYPPLGLAIAIGVLLVAAVADYRWGVPEGG